MCARWVHRLAFAQPGFSDAYLKYAVFMGMTGTNGVTNTSGKHAIFIYTLTLKLTHFGSGLLSASGNFGPYTDTECNSWFLSAWISGRDENGRYNCCQYIV